MKKFISFLAFICLFALISNYTLSQTRKKTTTKRAATTQKSSTTKTSATSKAKRAAVSSTSTKRAATSSSSTRRSATNRKASSSTARRVAARRATTGSRASTGTESEEAVSKNNCPIGVVIKKITDDEGKETFYSSKDNVCNEPENATGQEGLNGLSLPTWIAGKDAYVFSCNPGFMKSKENDDDVCIDENTICPLNTTISKKDGKYYNPFTSEECNLPASASALKLNEETNMNADIPVDEAYYAYCNKNHYKISDVECRACPTGKYNNGASIKYENITDEENKVVGKKSHLIEGATSENQCYTMEEMKTMQAN